MKKFLKIFFSILIVLLILFYVYFYVGVYKADEEVLNYLKSSSNVEVTKMKDGYFFDGPGTDEILIFYPGAKVEYTSYAKFLNKISEKGLDTYLLKMPCNFAFFDMNAADRVISSINHDKWIIGGHSLGGVVACEYAVNNPNKVSKVITFASYPTKTIPNNVEYISFYGSEDNILTKEAYNDAKKYWPENSTEYIIEGANHSSIALYGEQKGDGIANISNDKAQEKIIDLMFPKNEYIEEAKKYAEEFYRDGLKGTTVQNKSTIKPVKTFDKTFETQEDLDYYASERIEGDEVSEFYSSQTTLGDAVGYGLYSSYKASSTYKSQDNKYEVNNLNSLVYDKCWVEGASGDGIGETIEISTFDTSEKVEWGNYSNGLNRDCTSIDDVKDYLLNEYNGSSGTFGEVYPITKENIDTYHNYIDQIAIINGYAKDDTLWKNNNRVKKLKVTIDDSLEFYLELEDNKKLQIFDINYENEIITKPVNLKFEIVEVYKGDKYDDTCLSSLYLVGGSNVKWGGR